MEVLLCNFFNFFTDMPQQDQGKCAELPEKSDPVGHQTGQKEGRTAQRQKIDARPQEEGQHHINAQLPAPGGDGIEKEPRGDQSPEEEIQRGAQQGEPDPPPEDAEQIIYQAQRRPQAGGAQERKGLVQKVDAHRVDLSEQPGQEAAPFAPVVLIGQGVHASLHLQVSPVQTQLFDVEVLPPHHQGPLAGAHDNAVLVEALHLLHPRYGQRFPPLQNHMMGRSLRPELLLLVLHPSPAFPSNGFLL